MDKSTGPWTEFQSSSPAAESGPWDDFKAAPAKPRTRGLFEAVNDNVIEFANAAAGGVSALANMVKPGNAVSSFIDENIIKAGEQKQSDVVQGAKRQLSEGLQSAQGIGDEVGAVGSYVLNNPLLAASQAAGSFALPGGAVKGAGMAAKALGTGVKGVETAGRVGGIAAGAAMAGGDAASTAYDLASKAGATEEQALAAGRQASVIPALVGGVTGAFGAERLLAGAKGFGGNALSRGLKSGLSEAGQEALEEGVTQFEGQRAAMPYDESIDPTKGVAGAAAMGGIMGFGPGAVLGAMGDAKPSQQMGIDPNAGPLSRAAASAVDSQPVPSAEPTQSIGGSITGTAPESLMGRASDPLAAQIMERRQQEAADATPAQQSEPVPLEQRSLDELRQAFRSAQDPAIRKTLAAEIRKRREAMPDPLAQPQQEISLEPQSSQAVQSQPQEAQATEGVANATQTETSPAVAQEAAQGVGVERAPPSIAVDPQAVGGLASEPAKSAKPNKLKEARDARRAADELRGTTGASTVTGGDIPAPSVESPVADVRSAGRNDDAGAAQPDANGDAGRAVGSAAQGSAALRPEGWRTTAIKAGKVARSLGLDPKGKRLKEIVAEIDAVDAGSGVAAKLAASGYEAAKSIRDAADARVNKASEAMQKYPRGAMGLTPDDVKSSPQWKADKAEMDAAMRDLQSANATISKNFAKEYRAERDAKRAAQANVQNTPQGTAGEAKAPSVEASKAEGGNAASNAGVPAAGDTSALENNGVKSREVMPAGLTLEVGGKLYPVDSLAQASEMVSQAKQKFTEAKASGKAGGFVEDAPIRDGAGRIVGYVGRGGSVFDVPNAGPRAKKLYDAGADLAKTVGEAEAVTRPALPKPAAPGAGDVQADGVKEEAKKDAAPAAKPKATELTPKQFHEAKLSFIAADSGADMAEVREMYDTEGGRAEHQREWLRDVEAAAKAGETLSRQTLDKLYELAPNARLPETAAPNGYQKPDARKAEAEEKQARIDNRKAAKESVKTEAAAQAEKPAEETPQVTLTVENALAEVEKAKMAGRDALYRELATIRGLSNSVFNGVANRLTGSMTKDGREWSQESLTDFLMSQGSPATSENPATTKPSSKTPTIDRSMAVMDAVRAGTGSLEDYKASFAALESSEEAVKAELNAKTKDELLKAGGPYFYMRFKNETKPEIIRVFYKDLLNEYALGKSYGSSGFVMSSGGFAAHEKRQHEALKALVAAQTDEDLNTFAAEVAARREEVKAKREAKKAAMENPQTLEDFRSVMREHITDGKTRKEAFLMLTPEQRIRYDELEAETTKESRETRKRERKTEVRAADQATGGQIIATKHTRSGYDLFVVQLADRLSKEDYNTVLASAKKLGGWYSSFRGNGAVPGFQFKEKPNAEAFLKLAGGDTTDAQAQAEQRRDAFEDDRSQTAVERLRTMADKLEEQASDIEGADRKTNTARRAKFASRALAGAAEMKAEAKTMRNLAQAIEGDNAKFLDGIRTKTQVDMLTGMVATAKNNELRAKYESYADQEKRKGEPPTVETADFAEFPAFTAYRSDLASLARQMLEVEGTKKLGQQLMKVADDVSDAYIEFAKQPGNLAQLSTFSIRRGEEVKTAIFASRDLAERAIKRSGLTGKAIVLAEKRGVNRIIMSPSEAMNAKIWTGDGDKRITLSADAGNTLVEAIGRRGNKRNGLAVPWQLQTAHDRLKSLARMGIETPAEFRSALREFIGMQERAMSNKVREMELAMVGKKNDGLDFFPTPSEVADQMVEAADIETGMLVLEPSGGMGHIADRIRAAGAEPDVGEISEDRRELLEEKGYNLVARDFMDFTAPAERGFTFGDLMRAPDGTVGILRGQGGFASDRVRLVSDEADPRELGKFNFSELEGVERRGAVSGYDRIVMNPPFSNRRDAEHVQHAYKLLKPGGRVVAIMGEGVFFGSDKKAQDFRDWLDSVGGTDEKLPAGSFMDPSLPVNTGVNARMVVIDKPSGDASTQEDGDAFMGDKAKDQRQGTPVDRAIMDMAGEGREANEILSFIAKASKSQERRQLAQKLLENGANPSVSLSAELDGGKNFREGFFFIAQYSRKRNEITLSELAAGKSEQVFLHEMTHAATLLALDKGGLIAKQMGRLYEQVKASGVAEGLYGLKNVGEFVAEAFTNPEFQEAIKGIQVSGVTAWDRLVNIVRRILGMEPRQQDALSKALELGAGVMRENIPLRAAKSFRSEDGPAYAGETVGRKESEANRKAFLDGSKVRQVVYHATRADFNAFDTEKSDLGAHFGNEAQANRIAVGMRLNNAEGTQVMPVWLSIKNPLRLKDVGTFHADGIADQLERKGLLPKGEGKRIIKEIDADWRLRKKYDPMLRKIIQDAGYDGVVYANTQEGKGDSYIVFRPEQIKSATGNRGTFDPDDADIAHFGIADAVEQIKAFDVKEAPKNTWAHYRGMALQALGRRQLVDLYGDEFGPHLKQYDYLVQQMDAEKNETGAEADNIAQRWGNLKDEKALAELMHDATLAKMDPDKPMPAGYSKAEYDKLKTRFNTLSPEAKTLYREARDMYVAHYKAVQQAIKDRIERSEMSPSQKKQMMAQLDDKLFKELQGVYFPLARFGQYVIVVKDANGEVKNVTRAETVKEAEQARKELQKAFPSHMGNTVGKVLKQAEFNAGRDAVGKGFMADLMNALDEKGVDDELRDTVAQLYLSSLPDLSWAKHGIHRKGTPGFSQDARRAFAQNSFHGARYLAKLRYSDRLQDELTGMQEYVKAFEGVEEYDSIQGQQVVDEMVKRHEILMNPKASPVSTALTSFGFLFHMGLSPASAMVNLTQTALVAYPQMGAKWGFTKAGTALTKASEEVVRAKNDLSKSLNGAELDAFERAVKDGTIDVTMAHDLAGIAQGEDQGVMWKIRPVMRWASFMFHHAEKFNRQATFLAAFRLSKEANPEKPLDWHYEAAKKATYDGHFDYSAANRARIMQGNWQRVILLFKQYAQAMVYTLARNAYQSVKSLDPKERSQARKTLAGILAAHAAAAGVLGLPIVGPLLTVASWIGGDDDEPWDAEVAMQNAMAEMIGPKAAEVVARGFSRLTPFDLSGRVALNKLILPDVQEGLEGKEWAESAMAAALGPVAGIGVNMARGAQKITEGDYLRGMEDMMPTALRGPLKALRYANEGAVDKTGIVITDEVGAAGVLGQASGFSPSQVRRDTERRSAIYSYDRALLERRSVLMRMMAEARIQGDTETAEEVQKDIQRFNEKNPTRRITPMNIAQSIRNRRKRTDEAEQGVYLPSKRRDALDAVSF